MFVPVSLRISPMGSLHCRRYLPHWTFYRAIGAMVGTNKVDTTWVWHLALTGAPVRLPLEPSQLLESVNFINLSLGETFLS